LKQRGAENLRHLWTWTGDKIAADWHLRSWIAMARISGIAMLRKFATTLEEHFEGILAYFNLIAYRQALSKVPT